MSARRSLPSSPARRTPSRSRAAASDQDELSSPAPPLRALSAQRSSTASTPYSRLRQLAGAIHTTTPAGARTPSAAAASARRSERTPARGGPARAGPAGAPKPATPHAIRALMVRKAAAAVAATPGRERRRSGGRQLRETPRDVLRALSRVEKRAGTTPRAERQERRSQVPVPQTDDSESEDEPRPNLTLPLEDDDDSFLAPPRLSMPLDDENTQMSIEGPRRDFAGLGRAPSLGLRTSERFGDVGEVEGGALGGDESLEVDAGRGGDGELGDETGDLRNVLDGGRPSLPYDASLGVDDAENSFAFRLPPDLEDDELEPPSDEASEAEPRPEDLETANVTLDFAKPPRAKAKTLHQSRYGIPYPSLPAGVVKKLTAAALKASGKSKTRVNRGILAAVMQASDWFFEQLGEDLEAYSNHAKRKTIDESDVVTLMKRQRLLNASTTPFSLAQKQLPRELLQDLRMVQPGKTARRRVLAPIAEESE